MNTSCAPLTSANPSAIERNTVLRAGADPAPPKSAHPQSQPHIAAFDADSIENKPKDLSKKDQIEYVEEQGLPSQPNETVFTPEESKSEILLSKFEPQVDDVLPPRIQESQVISDIQIPPAESSNDGGNLEAGVKDPADLQIAEQVLNEVTSDPQGTIELTRPLSFGSPVFQPAPPQQDPRWTVDTKDFVDNENRAKLQVRQQSEEGELSEILDSKPEVLQSRCGTAIRKANLDEAEGGPRYLLMASFITVAALTSYLAFKGYKTIFK